MMTLSPFDIMECRALSGPVVLSVPHAGRSCPTIGVRLRHPVARLRALEDRYADLLIAPALRNGTKAIVARTSRLWIDLNRAESDLDATMVEGRQPGPHPVPHRVRGGLGLIPRRLADLGEIWHLPLTQNDVAARIVAHHRPYHAALAQLLSDVRQQFGTALLIDVHSMPTLAGNEPPQIVIGDRFGTTCAPRLTACAEAVGAAAGFRIAVNAPYAGGYITTRHGRPNHQVHALQIEVDRRLYLDAAQDQPGPGLARVQALIARLIAALNEELLPALAIAAE